MRESIDCPLEESESVETVRRRPLAVFGGSVVNSNGSSFPYREVESLRIVWLRRMIPLSSPYRIVDCCSYCFLVIYRSLFLGLYLIPSPTQLNPNPN